MMRRYWLIWFIILLFPAPTSLAQSSPIITADNADQLEPLLEVELPRVHGMGWHDNQTVFVETSIDKRYYDLTTGMPVNVFTSAFDYVSPDGRFGLDLIYDHPWSRKYDFYLYDAQTGKTLVEMPAIEGTESYTNAIFTPDGSGILLSDGARIDYINVQALLDGTARPEFLISSDQPLILSPFSQPNNLILAMGGSGGTVNIWQISDIHQITEPPQVSISSESGYAIPLYKFVDSNTLLTRERSENSQYLLRWWDIHTGSIQREFPINFEDNRGKVETISPDAHYLIVTTWGSSGVEVWDISTNAPNIISIPDTQGISFSPDSQRGLYMDSYGFLAWFDLTAREKHILAAGFARSLEATTFNASNDLLLIDYTLSVTNYPHVIELWDIPNEQIILTEYEAAAAFSPDGQSIVIGDKDGILRLLDAHTGKTKRIITDPPFSAPITAVAFHPGGTMIVCGLANNSFYLIETENGTLHNISDTRAEYREQTPPDFFFSPSGTILVALIKSFPNRICIWDLNTLRNIYCDRIDLIWSNNLQFSPDERWIAIGGNRMVGAGNSGVVQIYDTHTGEKLAAVGSMYTVGELPDANMPDGCEHTKHSKHFHAVYALAFHPDGNFLAAASSDNLALWDIPTAIQYGIGIEACGVDGVNEMIYSFTLPGGGGPTDMDMVRHPTQPLLAFSSSDGHVYLWDFSDPLDVQVRSIEQAARTVGFSPDGRLLAVGGDTIEFFEVDSLRPVDNLPDDLVQLVADDIQFSPTGQYLLLTRDWDRITLWGIPIPEPS